MKETETDVTDPDATGKVFVFIPGGTKLNFSNQALPPPAPKYDPVANMRSGHTESWADILREKR